MNIAEMSIDEKKKLYTKANKVYNDDPNGKLLMTDAEFDKLERQIKRADPTWVGLRATGAKVNKKVAVRLPQFMPSLNKVYPEALDKWRAKQSAKRWLAMEKLDGSALIGTYRSGRCMFLATRGDGTLGKDISFLIPFLNLPVVKEKGEFHVRFEAVVENALWSKKWKEEFDNPRQMANGLLNRRAKHAGHSDINLVVLGVYDKPVQTGLKWASSQGFRVVHHQLVKLTDDFEALLEELREEADYDIDGMVLAPVDAIFQYDNADRPKWTVAFKVNDESQAVNATVEKIIWQLSRAHRWTPKIFIKPTKIGAVMVQNCTAHNAQWMNDRRIGVGAVVKLVRSGDVIPKIVGVVKKAAQPSHPPGEFYEKGVHYFATERHADADVRAIHHFFATLDIEHIARKTIEKLHPHGFESVLDYVNAYGKRMKGFTEAGVGKAMTAKIYDEMSRVLHDEGVPLLKLMNASNCFESFGERKLQMIENYYMKKGDKDPLRVFVKMTPEQLGRERIRNTVADIKGMGDKSAEQFYDGLWRFKTWLLPILKTKLVKINAPAAPVKKRAVKGDLSGEFVSFTSYRNAEHEAAVAARGAEVIKYGAKTTILLYKEGGKASSKVDAAKAKGIKVCTFDEL
jgi:NAD-dependent DNA ligase